MNPKFLIQFTLTFLLSVVAPLLRAEAGQALPRAGGAAGIKTEAPMVAANLSGARLPVFRDFHTRLGARMAVNFRVQALRTGVEISTRRWPKSAVLK